MFGIAGGGAQADYVAVPAGQCARGPDGLDLITMGGAPEAFVTAHDALVSHAHVQPGEWVLIHAVGSGVGTTALQLAIALGARVIGTARTRSRSSNAAAARARTHGLVAEGRRRPARRRRARVGDDRGHRRRRARHRRSRGRPLRRGRRCRGDGPGPNRAGRRDGRNARATLPILAVMGKRLTIIGTVLRGRNARREGRGDRRIRPRRRAAARRRPASLPIVETVLPLDRVADAYDLVAVRRNVRQGHPRLPLIAVPPATRT